MLPRDVAELDFTEAERVAVAQHVARHFSAIHDHPVGAVEIFDDGVAWPHKSGKYLVARLCS